MSRTAQKNRSPEAMPEPPPFPTGEPAFLQDLRRPFDCTPRWDPNPEPEADEADFRNGLALRMEFPDPEGLLHTAETDFLRFLDAGGLRKPGASPVVARKTDALSGESFRLTVTPDSITLEAGGIEGIRRGLYFLTDRLLEARAPFLKCGSLVRKPWLKNRISRCFFGPIKRPPFNRDELMDDVDYYPEEYLSKLAREGVNGLWLTVVFREVCTTSLLPRDPDAEHRLEKLRRTVEKCRRYGIRIWIFCIEPACWNPSANPCPPDHPELKGPPGYSGISFCPASATAQQYLYECTRSLFSAVPHLGGIITISLGERLTSCLSTLPLGGGKEGPCGGRCALEAPEILAQILRPMAAGMRSASPDAQLISWLYIPQEEPVAEWIFHLPEKWNGEIILTFNFESGCSVRQLGRCRTGGDYWLSVPGPSDRFGRMASAAHGHCSIGAKIQACCSHEIATVPFVPVPGLLYRKYRAMKRLGVEHVIQCWYFGNYPGLMNRAAGELAFETFEDSEEAFSERLARRDWGSHAHEMARVWKLFSDAYSHYPLDLQFQYYGPMHDGPVWPLHLKQVLRSLPRSWKPDEAPAGDLLSEALFNFDLREAALLCRRLSDTWNAGMDVFNTFRSTCTDSSDRRLDASLMDALALQFRSGADILEFYLLRGRLLDDPPDPLRILRRLEEIVNEEAGLSRALADLCRTDPRLGYHSEAEVCKYFPEKLFWRAGVLEHTLAADFPEFRRHLLSGGSPSEFLLKPSPLYRLGTGYSCGNCLWRAEKEKSLLRITVDCFIRKGSTPSGECVRFFLLDRKGRRTPWTVLRLSRSGESCDSFRCAHLHSEEHETHWRAVLEIPRIALDDDSAVWFGFQHEWQMEDGSIRRENCPEGTGSMEARLNLDFFRPERLLLLELIPVRESRTAQ